MHRLILCEQVEDGEPQRSRFGDLPDITTCLSLEPFLPNEVPHDADIRVRSVLEVIPDTDLTLIREQAYRMMHEFACLPEWTAYQGVPAGEATLHLYRFFIEPIFQVELLDRILFRSAAGEVVDELVWAVADPGFHRVLRHFLDSRRPHVRLRYAASRRVAKWRGSRLAELFETWRSGGASGVAARVRERLFPERGAEEAVATGGIKAGSICFALEYENHYKSFLPLAGALENGGQDWSILAFREGFKQFLLKSSCPFIDGEGADPVSRDEAASRAGEARDEFRRRWRRLEDDGEFQGHFSCRDVPLFPLVRRTLKALFDYQFVVAVRAHETVRAALIRIRPAMLVVMDDVSMFGRIAVEAARGLGVPTLNIQHGAIGDVNHYRAVSADRMAVWGRTSLDLLAESGVDPERMVVTGQPRFDGLATAGEAGSVRTDLGIPERSRLILWTPAPMVAHRHYRRLNQKNFKVIVRAVASIPETVLVVKLHPIDDPGAYRSSDDAVEQVRLVTDIDVARLLPASDLLIAQGTTVMVEAMFCRVPVVALNLFELDEFIPCESYGAAVSVRREEDLSPALEAALAESPEQREQRGVCVDRFLEAFMDGRSGRATLRVLELISSMSRLPESMPHDTSGRPHA